MGEKKRYKIELKGMKFFAYHGCFEEEQVIGNHFIVSLTVEGDFSRAAQSDNIIDAVNYQDLYNIVKKEMMITSHLLENVADRIVRALKEKYPLLEAIEVTIDKLNPPLGGQLCASSVTIKYPKS